MGFGGNDVIHCGSGNDSLIGYVSNDRLFGLHGNDYLNGDKGNDFLRGGHGEDNFYPGLGDDVISGLGKGGTVHFSGNKVYYNFELGTIPDHPDLPSFVVCSAPVVTSYKKPH